MDRLQQINPFAKRETHSSTSITTYKILTLLTWVLSVVTSVYYSTTDDKTHNIWHQNYLFYSAFTQNAIITSIYFVILFILQLVYISHLFSSDSSVASAAASVGSHFIVNNVLHTIWVLLFVNTHFVWSEIILLINFANLTSLYFRYNTYGRFIHAPAISGPLCWTFVAIYWNGAIMIPHQHSLFARILANVVVWSVLVYGGFFIVVYKDYTVGFALSVLTASLGVAQFFRQIVAFQWIFAFTIMSLLFVFTLLVAVPAWTGREVAWGGRASRTTEPADTERAPLLGE
ncbi:hypothetical protein QBC38DRAFT_365668 [Podospora fimiseda]|uniref:ATP synthase F0 n=1 Tax=Podospora fimiseda TaxID=252190 RepID=A0AAN7BNR7_9PEZI|nr:hypothetical protein QBC38DRAFT_365668 [Podospora fimiseda]